MSLFSLLADILYVGHSLVGPDLPLAVEATLRAMDEPAAVRAQVINGAPLGYNWDNAAEAQGVNAREVLPRGETEVLILTEAQPLANHLRWSGTAENAARFAALAVQANPATRIYLYETWPSLTSGTPAALADDPAGAVPWRDRVRAERLLWEDTATQASVAVPMGIIPAGQALGLLADAIEAGQAPGLTSIRDLFQDDIHLNHKGTYFVALVHAAAITGRSPEGLPAQVQRPWPSRDSVISDDLAPVLQRLAWQAVSDQTARTLTAAPVSAPEVAEAAPAPPPAVTPPGFAPITNPNLGFGLAGISDWSPQQPFLDVMKTARPWVGHLPGQWGGWDHDRLAAEGYLDADGWPTALPPELTGISTLILTDLAPEAGGVAGRYDLTHAGTGSIRVEGRVTNVDASPGRISFDFTPGEGTVLITLDATDPADPIRDITVVRQDRAAALAAGEVFNPDWLARIRGARLVRFMDWSATNDSVLARAGDRPRPDDYTWARNGVPIEVQIALANTLQADPWFTLPHLAEDALITDWATLAHTTLDPALNAHVELSNEVWNWQFAQARWADEQARARWGAKDAWVQFYAFRAMQAMSLWTDVYGPDAPARLTRVIGTQTGWLGLEDVILNAPLVQAEGLPAPATRFDAYAVTGYFSARVGSPEKLPLVEDWLAQSAATVAGQADATARRHDLAITLAAQELRDGSLSGDPADSLQAIVTEVLPYHAAVAARHDLRLMMYEGGTHVVGYGALVDDAELTDFFIALNYAPEMGALYADLLAGWTQISDAPFNAFVDVSGPSKWGSWGGLRHLNDDNPRWQALARGCDPC